MGLYFTAFFIGRNIRKIRNSKFSKADIRDLHSIHSQALKYNAPLRKKKNYPQKNCKKRGCKICPVLFRTQVHLLQPHFYMYRIISLQSVQTYFLPSYSFLCLTKALMISTAPW